MSNDYVGAWCTIRWNDPRPEEREDCFFSFEELPEDFDTMEDYDYVLPKACIREDNVFYFCTQEELLGMGGAEDTESEFVVLSVQEWVLPRSVYDTPTNTQDLTNKKTLVE